MTPSSWGGLRTPRAQAWKVLDATPRPVGSLRRWRCARCPSVTWIPTPGLGGGSVIMVSGPRGQDTCPGPLSSGESKPPGGDPAVTCDTPRVPQGPADGRRGSRLGARITGSLLGPGHPSRLQASMWGRDNPMGCHGLRQRPRRAVHEPEVPDPPRAGGTPSRAWRRLRLFCLITLSLWGRNGGLALACFSKPGAAQTPGWAGPSPERQWRLSPGCRL